MSLFVFWRSTHAFIEDALIEMVTAVTEIKVVPVEQSVVIDLNTLGR